MHFGLINAGETFQRAMDVAFRGLINQSVVVYLDDITIYSKKRSDHLHHLRQVLEHCIKYGIFIKFSMKNKQPVEVYFLLVNFLKVNDAKKIK